VSPSLSSDAPPQPAATTAAVASTAMIELLVFTPLPPKSINPVGFGENTRFSSRTIEFIVSIGIVARQSAVCGPHANSS
jgi:hypothetical protein